jgi:hypothetical protein
MRIRNYQKEFLSINRRKKAKKIKEINKFKINDSENGVMASDVLQINGSSYCEGMPDYDWFFSIASKDFPNLLNA